MRRLLFALPIIALLALAPSAFAGGWATVGLSSTPAGTEPGNAVEREPDGAPARADAAARPAADDHDPQRRRAPRRSREADRQARRLPRRGRVPERRARGPTRSTTASSPASRTRIRPCRSAKPASAPAAATTSDDGGPGMLGSRSPGSRSCSRPRAAVWRPPRRHRISRRRRESHHPRCRWPRLRGGGDDDRRLRRRRLGSAAARRAPRAAPARRRTA